MTTGRNGSRLGSERDTHVSGESELRRLGYEQELKRTLGLVGNVALTVAAITPASSILAIGGVALVGAGTGVVWAYLIAAVVAFCMALTYAELGSMYPTTGGEYPIISRVLGRLVGLVDMFNIMSLAVFIPAAIALAFGTYLRTLLPGANPNLAACVVVVIATGLAMLSISDNAWITKTLVALELVLLAGLVVLGFSSVRQPVDVLLDPVSVSVSESGTTTAVGFAVILSTVTTGLFSYNGYDAAINFSEETQGEARQTGRAVMVAVLVAVLFQIVPLTAIILAAPDLGGFFGAVSPFTYVAESVVGPAGNTIITVGILVAVFAAVQAIILVSARVVYCTGRDMAWPAPISDAFTKVSARYSSPWVGALMVGSPAAVLTLFAGAVEAVTFAGVAVAFNYALVAACAIVSRIRHPGHTRPWRMPLWPLPPVVALVGVAVAISQQEVANLLVVTGISVAAVVYYALFLRPRGATHWRAQDHAGDPRTEGVRAEGTP